MGIPCFGPSRAAAQLETSKAFTKDFCGRYGLPTAAYGAFDDVLAAKTYIRETDGPYVIKADGLAAGKGVVIAETLKDAEIAVENMMSGRYGSAGDRVVIEEFMQGEEASVFALCDGDHAILFGYAQDHKRAFDGDLGPNTGGMGTYSPAPVVNEAVLKATYEQIIRPAVEGMARDGHPYRGVLFAGLMIKDDQPRLVEFNCRFGDPECQVLMLRLQSDLVPYLLAAATGTLAKLPAPQWSDGAAVCVVYAAKGYPESPLTGSQIRGLDQDFGPETVIFHAGTTRDEQGLVRAASGRVLNVCATGADLGAARDGAYEALSKIDWPGGFYRRDIAWRAFGR